MHGYASMAHRGHINLTVSRSELIPAFMELRSFFWAADPEGLGQPGVQ